MNVVPMQPANSLSVETSKSGLELMKAGTARTLVAAHDRTELATACRTTLALAEPAKPSFFAAQFQRLASHYPATPLTAPEREVVIRDWRDMLGHLPTDILAESVRRFIMSPARFFPTPGQLYEIAKPLWAEREHLARRARDAMEMINAR